VGAAVALPMLDAMAPSATAAVTLPRRVGFIYVPHGADMKSWTPEKSGADFEFSPTLKALEPFRKYTTVISNLKRGGTVVEMHAGASSGWLSGAIPKRTEGEDYGVGETVDQVLAKQIGQASQFPSLEFATEDFTGYVGGCAPGYTCAYMNTISWATATTPLPMEINPRPAFERLFGDGGSESQRRRAAGEDSSILDAITAEARTLEGRLGSHDRARVNDYLDNIREVERRIQHAEAQHGTDIALMDKPLGIPEAFEDHSALMFDLLALAFQADLTRIFTFMMSREGSYRTFNQIGISDPWHVTSHHGEQPEKIARNAKINTFCLSMFVKFLERMRNTPDGEGSILDRSLFFYGSGMSNSNVHATDPLPMLAVGGGLAGNRHLVLPKKTEIGNLWLTVANRFGEPLEKFGESTGTIDSL
jgi:hypothetical protein